MPPLPLGLALVAAATRRTGHETRALDLLAAADRLLAERQLDLAWRCILYAARISENEPDG